MLARLRNAKENGESGFTLIELLVVMIIIGILAAIAIPAFLNQKKKAVETSAKADATNMYKEVAAFAVDGDITVLTIGSAVVGTIAAPTGTSGTCNGATSQDCVLFATTAAGNSASGVRVTSGNVATVTGSTPNFCITVTPASATGGSAWTAGRNGLLKGTTCT